MISFDIICFFREVYSFIRGREDCGEGTEFYRRFLRSGKQSPLANFLTRCLKRIDFVSRKNSIGQVVPDSWREDAKQAAEKIRQNLSDCDIIVNADQTFVKLYMEDESVLAPVGTKRVGGKVNPVDKKSGFTIMVTVEMFSNMICNPFIVFTGTKKTEAKRPESTLNHKYALLFIIIYYLNYYYCHILHDSFILF